MDRYKQCLTCNGYRIITNNEGIKILCPNCGITPEKPKPIYTGFRCGGCGEASKEQKERARKEYNAWLKKNNMPEYY